MAYDEPRHVPALRAQRESDADLLRPLADQIRDDAVEANARQKKRHCGEGVEQDHRKALRGQRAGDHLIHRLRSGDDVLAVLALRHVAQRGPERRGWYLGARYYAHAWRAARQLPERFVELSL